MRQGKIWMILDHPHQLAIALPLAFYWRPHGIVVNLLISPHPYWRLVRPDDYANQFDQVFRFQERPDYVYSPRESVLQIREILRCVSSLHETVLQIREILQLKRQVTRLGIKQDDVIIGLSHSTFIENIVLSCTPNNTRIAIIPELKYREALARHWSAFKLSRGGLFARYLVQPLTGLEKTLQLMPRNGPFNSYGGSGVETFEREVTDVYDKVVVLVSLYEEFGKLDFSSKTVFLPFPYVLMRDREHQGTDDEKKEVIFFGDSFAQGGQPTSIEKFAECTNECLSFLRRTYANTHRLVYRPHPHETDADLKLLDLSQFEIAKHGQLAELYMSDHKESIDAVFSVYSTASRSAVNYGINSYVFFELFGFDESSNRVASWILGRQPDSFFVKSLSTPPVKYQDPQRLQYVRALLQESLDSVVNVRASRV